jgi:hypothetical protein
MLPGLSHFVLPLRYFLTFIELLQKATNSIELDIGEDRILLQTRSNVYYLDIYLPYDLIQEECGAQFNKKTRVCINRGHLKSVNIISGWR